MDAAAEWGLVALLGALVGVGELVSRYRDAPGRALWTLPALIYVALNAVAGLVALALATPITQGQSPIARVLIAGFGAMAVLRSSVFVVRSGEQDVAVGPSSLLQIVIGAADRAVDRHRARVRASAVAAVMNGVVFKRAYASLPTYCLALMQNLPPEDQQQLGRQIKALQDDPMNEDAKVLALGLALMNAVGEDVLLAAVTSLGPHLRGEQEDEPSLGAGP